MPRNRDFSDIISSGPFSGKDSGKFRRRALQGQRTRTPTRNFGTSVCLADTTDGIPDEQEKAGRIMSFFNDKGLRGKSSSPGWALRVFKTNLHRSYAVNNAAPAELPLNQRNNNAREALDKDRFAVDGSLKEMAKTHFESLKNPLDNEVERRSLGLLFAPMSNFADIIPQDLVDEALYELQHLVEANKKRQEAALQLARSIVTIGGITLRAKFQDDDDRGPSCTSNFTTPQRIDLQQYFQRYTLRVSSNNVEFMPRSSWFRILGDMKLFGPKQIKFSKAREVFHMFSEYTGGVALVLTFANFLNALQFILKEPHLYPTQTELCQALFTKLLKRCEHRLPDPLTIESKDTIRRMSKSGTMRSATSNLGTMRSATSNLGTTTQQKKTEDTNEGWCMNLVEEQICEPEVVLLVEEFRNLFRTIYDRYAVEEPASEGNPACPEKDRATPALLSGFDSNRSLAAVTRAYEMCGPRPASTDLPCGSRPASTDLTPAMLPGSLNVEQEQETLLTTLLPDDAGSKQPSRQPSKESTGRQPSNESTGSQKGIDGQDSLVSGEGKALKRLTTIQLEKLEANVEVYDHAPKQGTGGVPNQQKEAAAEQLQDKSAKQGIDWERLHEHLPWETHRLRERKRLFSDIDVFSNGHLSLSELDTYFCEVMPEMSFCKPALTRAFHIARAYDEQASDSDWSVGKREFRILLEYLHHCFHLWVIFERVDTGHDGHIGFDEFKAALPLLNHWGLDVNDDNVQSTFNEIDADHGGYVLFGELCDWAITQRLNDEDEDDETNRLTTFATEVSEEKTAEEAEALAEALREEQRKADEAEDALREAEDALKQEQEALYALDQHNLTVEERLGHERYVMGFCEFLRMLRHFGLYPSMVSLHTARINFLDACSGSKYQIGSFPEFVESLLRVCFTYLSVYGNCVQQTTTSKRKFLWIVTWLQNKCNDRGLYIATPREPLAPESFDELELSDLTLGGAMLRPLSRGRRGSVVQPDSSPKNTEGVLYNKFKF